MVVLQLIGLLTFIHAATSLRVDLTRINKKSPQIFLPQTSLRQNLMNRWDMAQLDTDSHIQGWNGTFDNKIKLSNAQNEAGAIYVGELFISDTNQKVRLIFDTGSDYLAMTSSLCEDIKFGPKYKNSVNKSIA